MVQQGNVETAAADFRKFNELAQSNPEGDRAADERAQHEAQFQRN
jgi:hypothetical protein